MRRVGIAAKDSRPTVRVRRARPSDRPALEVMGHPPGAVFAIAPSPAGRLEWRTRGMRIVGLVAVERDGQLVGSIHFVRHRREPKTWLFGHWRVSVRYRRSGIGRYLLREGLRVLPEVSRLYSFVDWGNEGSVAAHRHLGFEVAPELWGSSLLGPLSTLGSPAPTIVMAAVPRSGRAILAQPFRRAMGPLWCRLFPDQARRGEPGPAIAPWDLRGAIGHLWRRTTCRYRTATSGDRIEAIELAVGMERTLFLDPESCDPGLLSRLAQALLASGCDRSTEIEIRGVARSLIERGGPIRAQILMGLTHVGALRQAQG